MKTIILAVAAAGSALAFATPAAAQYGAQYGAPYGNAYGYQGQGQGYAAQGDLTFRCNVAYNGAVTDVRIGRNRTAYNRGY